MSLIGYLYGNPLFLRVSYLNGHAEDTLRVAKVNGALFVTF